jgi:agmatine deiminase
MSFPPDNATFGHDLGRFRAAWTNVVNTIAQYEPVNLLARPGDAAAARALLDTEAEHPVTVLPVALDDAWLRDSGPTFTLEDGWLSAVHWRFNAWGDAGFSEFADEQHLGGWVARQAGVVPDRIAASAMVNEGGGLHVDGEGTVLLTETVQLDPGRNPGWTREQVEHEVHARLGTAHAIWLPRGLTRDYERFGTRGHVDIVTCFVRPGTLVAHVQPDPAHPDHAVSRELLEFLRSPHDAAGRRLEVIELPAPTVLDDGTGWVDYSYVNHYVCNGAVIACAFDDPRDDLAAELLAECYPDREVVLVDARPLFECGGGIHCITQQEPAVTG